MYYKISQPITSKPKAKFQRPSDTQKPPGQDGAVSSSVEGKKSLEDGNKSNKNENSKDFNNPDSFAVQQIQQIQSITPAFGSNASVEKPKPLETGKAKLRNAVGGLSKLTKVANYFKDSKTDQSPVRDPTAAITSQEQQE